MEPRFGRSFATVRVHTGPSADAAAREAGARAFTIGQDIWFEPGSYEPRSRAGRSLLAHELVHTIQQTGGLAADGIGHPSIRNAPRQLQRAPCQQTNHPPGNLPHELLEDDYITRFPGGRKEFEIPGSGPLGGTGWADLANVLGRTIYEIKTWTGVPAGQAQRDRYVLGANAHCGGVRPWIGGRAYPYTVLPLNASTEIVARQYLHLPNMEGIIVYWTRRRRRQRAPQPAPLPAWVWVLIVALMLAALAVALAEPTPAGEVIWAIALVLLLLGTGVIGSSPAMAATTSSGPSPAIPPPPMDVHGGGDLLEELGAMVARHPDAYLRLAASPSSAAASDLLQLYQDAVEARDRIGHADPDDPFLSEVRAAIRQIRPYVRRAMRVASDASSTLGIARRALDYL